jgi:hypothetical protein
MIPVLAHVSIMSDGVSRCEQLGKFASEVWCHAQHDFAQQRCKLRIPSGSCCLVTACKGLVLQQSSALYIIIFSLISDWQAYAYDCKLHYIILPS